MSNEQSNNAQNSDFLTEQIGLPPPSEMPSIQQQIFREPRTFAEGQFPSLFEATHSAAQAAKELSSLAPSMQDTIKAYEKSAASISEAAGHFSSLIENIKKILEDMPLVRPFLSKVLDAITLLYDITMALVNKIFYTVPSLIVRLFQLFGVDTLLINAFVRDVVQISVSPKIVQERVVGAAHGEQIFSLLTQGLGTLMLGKAPDLQQMKYVNEAIRFKTGIAREARDLGEMALLFIKAVPEQLQIWLSYVVPTKWWLDLFAPGSKYYTWVDEVNSIDSVQYTMKAAYDHVVQQQILQLHATGQELLKVCTQQGTRVQQVYRLLEATFRKVDLLYKIVDTSALNRGGRRVPFVVYLFGLTGQGKSFLMTILPAILAGCPHDEPNLAYARNACIPHWDGYRGQFAVKYDDFGAVNQSNATPGELGELLTVVSPEQMNLPMASLEDKGATFRSQVVIISSNIAYIVGAELRDASALHRRRHVFVEVRVKPEYRLPGSNEVDPALIPADYSHWEFIEKDKFNPQITYRTLNYQEFLNDTRLKYRQHVQAQLNATINYEQMIAAANLPTEVIIGEAHGLADDFCHYMTLHNAARTPAQQGAVERTEGLKFLDQLRKIDEEAEKPPWVKALLSFLPVAGMVAGLVGLGFGIRKLVNSTYAKKHASGLNQKEIESVVNDLKMLKTPRIQMLDAEGRWDRLYNRIKDSTPELTEIWSSSMDKEPCFADLNDAEVEALIDYTLRKPHIQKFLQAEGVYSGHHYKTQNRMTNKLSPKMSVPMMKAEGCIDTNAMEITTGRLVPHLGRVKVDGYGVTCLFIGGRVILTVSHVFHDESGDLQEDGVAVEAMLGTTTYRCLFRRDNYIKIGQDVCLYQMDVTMQAMKNTWQHFIKNEDLAVSRDFPALLATVDKSGVPIVFRVESNVTPNIKAWWYTPNRIKEQKISRMHSSNVARGLLDDKDFEVDTLKAWAYRLQSFPGMCGSPLVLLDKLAARKVVGIHAAGDPEGNSIAQPVTQEMILEGLKHFEFCLQPFAPKVDGRSPELGMLQAHGNFTWVGTLLKHPRVSSMTKICPSITHGKIFPVRTAPAVLDTNDLRAVTAKDTSMLRAGVEKYGKIAPYVDMPLLKRVQDSMVELFAPFDGKVERRILTQHEALNGVKGDDFVKRMDMTTSAGWPWNSIPGMKGKSPLIQRVGGASEDFCIVDDKLQAVVDQRWNQAKNGKLSPSLWVDTLKDERRTLDRIRNAKTRVFTIPPVDFTIVCRRLFGAFASAFYHSRLKTPSAVGIDPGSFEWTAVYNKLQNVSSRGFSGDFSGWDGNLSPQFMESVCNIINAWYGDAEVYQRARRVIFEEIIHTPQCALNEVYYTHQGNPSGNPLTVIINTILHIMGKVYIYYKVAPAEYNSWPIFCQKVAMVIYGDDGAYTLNPEVLPFFNPKVCMDEYKLLNLEFTNAKKTGPPEMQSLDDFTFLKRGFRDDGFGRKLATMDIQTITELTNWTRTCADLTLEQASLMNLNDSLSFMYAYGKKQFDVHREKIKSVLDAKYHSMLHDYMYYHKMFLSKVSEGHFCPDQPSFGWAHGDAKGDTLEISSETPITTAKGEDVRSDENKGGVVVQSQRDIEVSGSTLEPHSVMRGWLQRQCIGDPEWTLKKMVNRTIWVNTYQWTAAMGMGTNVFTLRMPQDVILNYLQSAAFERYMLWRGSVIIEVMVTGMRQQLGRVKVYNIPFTDQTVAAVWHQTSPTSYYGLNPLSVDPSSNSPQRLIVPFTNPKTYISINGPTDNVNIDYIGTVMATVLVPLTAAAGSSNEADITVTASFGEDSEFCIPLNSSAIGFAYNETHRQQREQAAIFGRAHGGVVSNQTTITSYGNMDGTCVPQDLKGDDFSGMASGNSIPMPFDRAARSINPINNVRKYAQNFTHSKGSEVVTRMDLDPSNMNIMTRQHFSTNVDEMCLQFLQCTPTWAANISWPGTATAGTSLWSGFIGPMTSLFTQGTTNQVTLHTGTPVQMTQWEYNSMRYAFWKGGMRVRLEMVATPFHVGRICVTSNYGAPPGTAAGLRNATSQYATLTELNNEKSVFDFNIEWESPTSWKRVCRGPSSLDDPDVTKAWWNDYFTGSFDISVVTQLKTVAAAPPDITIIMSISGMPDFRVYMPTNANQTFAGAATQPAPIPRRKMGFAHGDKGTKAGTDATPTPPDAPSLLVKGTSVVPEGFVQPQTGDHFGKRGPIRHLRDVLRRYYPIFNSANGYNYHAGAIVAAGNDNPSGFTPMFDTGATPTVATNQYCIYDAIPVEPVPAFENVAFASYQYQVNNWVQPLAHNMLQFRAWGGGLRYKIFFGNITDKNVNPLTPVNSGVTFIPHGQFPYTGAPYAATRLNWAGIAANLASGFLGVGAGAGGGGGDFQGGWNSLIGTNYPLDLAGHNMANYSEIEIPFTTIYNWLQTEQALVVGNAAPDVLMPGVLLIYRIVQAPQGGTIATTDILSSSMTILQSVADDFRYGIYLGIPKIYPPAVPNQWPDTWVVGTTREKQSMPALASTSSDEEFENVPVEDMTKSMLVKRLMHKGSAHGSWTSKTEVAYWEQPRSVLAVPNHDSYQLTSVENGFELDDEKRNFAYDIFTCLASSYLLPAFVQLTLLREKGLRVTVVKTNTGENIINWIFSSQHWLGDYTKLPAGDTIDWDNVDLIVFRQIYSRVRVPTMNFLADVPLGEEDEPLTFGRAHGDPPVVPEPLPPTSYNIRLSIMTEYDKYERESGFMARSAINEIRQKIETVEYTVETAQVGPSHIPTFRAKAMFLVNNPLYTSISGEAHGKRKKEAEENVALVILEKLYKIAKEDVCLEYSQIVHDRSFTPSKTIQENALRAIMWLTDEKGLPPLPGDTDAPTQLSLLSRVEEGKEITKLIEIMQNFWGESFFRDTVINQIKALLAVFGYQLYCDVGQHRSYENGMFKVEAVLVPLVKTNPRYRHYSRRSMQQGLRNLAIVDAVEDAIKSVIWEMFESRDSVLDKFVHCPTKLDLNL